jgi:hypothetical protein
VALHLSSSLADGETSKVYKMSSTHPNSILSDDLSSMIQREDMIKKKIDILGGTDCDPSTSSLVVDQNLQITISWFLLI